ncbi:MAG: helix-turn-helix domain-containing protein [Verrucomicrobia bacterium]|nr:helix-turn-helix domain-containing protein [Verrucomicrobiota bacterium]
MSAATNLQPTLWRTCRAIANRRRLRIFGWLVKQPDQTVSAVAHHLRLPLSLTSVYLRTLEARGLLTSRRVGRWVKYHAGSATAQHPASALAASLTLAFLQEAKPVETIFRLATAFTHPRRIEVFRVFHQGPWRASQVRAATHISSWALLRHLRKLESRGFIVRQGSQYAVAEQQGGLGRELARWAVK